MVRPIFAAIVISCMVLSARGDDAVDASTPKGAATAFFRAMENGDVAGAKALATGSDKQLAVLETLVPTVYGFKQLEIAVTKKWGEEGRKEIIQSVSGPAPIDIHDEIKTGTEEINGDVATIVPARPKPDDKTTRKLKKVDGKWKMDMSSMQVEGLDDPAVGKFFKSIGDVAKSMAGEIDQGKYTDVKSAKAALDQKITQALGANGAPGEPKK